MKLKRMEIKKLKLLDKIDFDFEGDISLLYGRNGIGKTTILEAISLVGHLSTMRRFSLKPGSPQCPGSRASRFVEELKAGSMQVEANPGTSPGPSPESIDGMLGDVEDANDFKELSDEIGKSSCHLDKMFQSFDKTGSVIRYELEVEGRTLSFCIYVRDDESLSITQALSRKKFDDLKMNGYAALIYDRDDEHHIGEIIANALRINVYMISASTLGEADQSKTYFLKYDGPVPMGVSRHGGAFYLNTDLNDFGRLRDVRESVKDIESDFVQEWVKRFRIRFDSGESGTEFNQKENLQSLMNKIITMSNPFSVLPALKAAWAFFLTPAVEFPLKEKDVFRLAQFQRLPNGRIRIEALREGYVKPTKIDYLSAGENECFFIFMYLLGTDIRNSICLLDEPDLHLSEFSKRAFFLALYGMLKDANCQVIMSTHSGFAYTNRGKIQRMLIRRKKNPPEFKTNFSWSFRTRLSFHYMRTALQVFGISGGVQIAIALLLFFGGLSFFSDQLGAAGSGIQTKDFHILVTKIITIPFNIIALVILYGQAINSVWNDITGGLPWKDQL